MFEFIARIVLASAGLASSGLRAGPSFDLTWRAVAFFCAYSLLLFLLEQRRLRNPGVSGLAAGVDGAVIALLLQDAGQIERFGFLTLTPVIWAAARHGANALLMAPVTAASLVSIANLHGERGASPVLLAQAAGILLIGLISPSVQTRVEIKEVAVPVAGPHPEQFREMRLRLRDALVELESVNHRAEREALGTALVNLTVRQGDITFDQLATSILQNVEASGVVVYLLDEAQHELRVAGSAGRLPAEIVTSVIPWPQGYGEGVIKSRIQGALRTLDAEGSACRAVSLVRDQGHPLGVVALFHPSPTVVDEALTKVEGVEATLARLVRWISARRDERRRLHLAELLYSVAAVGHGTDTIETLAARVARECFGSLHVDHLAIVDAHSGRILAAQGADGTLLDLVEFAGTRGLAGWIAQEAPETVIDDAHTDLRVPEKEAIKRRVGSFGIVPVLVGGQVVAAITVGTHRAGGITEEEMAMLRIVAGEMSQAWARIEPAFNVEEPHLTTPAEFRQKMAANRSGALVYLDVIKQEALVEKFGQPSFDKALREAAIRLKSLLPAGGFLCRRAEGDYVAFLPGYSEEASRRWAAQAVAAASLVPLTTPDGRARIPMNLRAKVAVLSTQLDRKSSQISA